MSSALNEEVKGRGRLQARILRACIYYEFVRVSVMFAIANTKGVSGFIVAEAKLRAYWIGNCMRQIARGPARAAGCRGLRVGHATLTDLSGWSYGFMASPTLSLHQPLGKSCSMSSMLPTERGGESRVLVINADGRKARLRFRPFQFRNSRFLSVKCIHYFLNRLSKGAHSTHLSRRRRHKCSVPVYDVRRSGHPLHLE
jgi:hypothetical protein